MMNSHIYSHRIFLALLFTLFLCDVSIAQLVHSIPGEHLPRPMVINTSLQWTESVDAPEHTGMPFQISFDHLGNGPLTYLWSSYNNGGERLYATTYENGNRSRSRLLSAGKGVYYQPVFLRTEKDAGWAFWQRKRAGQWEVVGRHLNEGVWEPIRRISGANQQALIPAATTFGSGVAVAWEDHSTDPQSIQLRIWDGSEWGQAERVSQPGRQAYRPALTSTPDGELWMVWDCYEGLNYAVYGKQVKPMAGKIEQISRSERSNLKPVILYGRNTGLVAAWISVVDIIGGKGVLDQWNTIRLAARRNGKWQLTSADGEDTIADLRHSLLNSIDPPDRNHSGYAGRRRHPILIESGGDVWLLWERKIEHLGISTLPGELCARRFDGKGWSDQVQLHSGMVNYQVSSSGKASENRLALTALTTQHQYYSFYISLEYTALSKITDVPGWKPVRLPLRDYTGRKSISLEGETYNLYWGDLHVHTGLTPDAEGQVDELMHFARDKANIDVVVMQENDAASWLNSNSRGVFQGQNLPESAYRLSVYYSRKYTEPGRFIPLPGWEWSDRTDDGRANHRTVIFAGDETPILRHTENNGNFTELCDAVEAAGGVMNTQHPDFLLTGRPVDANIEVVSGWGNYIDPPDKIHADLSDRFKVGFVGTSDGHRRNPGTGGGLTGIYARELTPEAIIDAIKQHRVYATNGNRMFIDARANDIFMGQDVESSGQVDLSLRVEAQKPLVKATLIRDGDIIYDIQADGEMTLSATWSDTPGSGFHWYYWEVQQKGEWPNYPGNMKVAEGHLAWTSPHRVTVK